MDSFHIRDFQEGQSFSGFYALKDANLLTSSQGKNYIRLTLADATGSIPGNMWDGDETLFATLTPGGAVKVRGTVESYRGNRQVKILAMRPALEDEYDPADFVPRTPASIEQLQEELERIIETVEDNDYNALLHAFFDDAQFMREFTKAPAAQNNHHAYIGGLLEHTITLCRLVDAINNSTRVRLDRDLLITGTLMHDVGKIRELAVTTSIQYTEIGGLLGHITIGANMIQQRAQTISDFPERKCWLVIHMVLSHHGKREFGSPVLPCIPEAVVLHHADNLDAKTVAARHQIDEDPNPNSMWTDWSRMLETRLYKGISFTPKSTLPDTAPVRTPRNKNPEKPKSPANRSLFE